MRKSKTVKEEVNNAKKEAEKAIARVKEIEALELEAQEEEIKNMDSLRERIGFMCKSENVFCGIILTAADIANIVTIAIESKETIKIPFNLYFND